MDFKFGQYIHRVHLNKNPLKVLEKRERGHIQGLPRVIISGTGRATNFKFCTHDRIDRNKNPLKTMGKLAVGVLRDSRKFSGHPYIGFCIMQ